MKERLRRNKERETRAEKREEKEKGMQRYNVEGKKESSLGRDGEEVEREGKTKG